MNRLQATAIIAVFAMASFGDAHGPYLVKHRPTNPPTTSTTHPTTTIGTSPSPAALETTSTQMTKRPPYPAKKTHPTPAALETTMVHISKHPPYPAKKTHPTPAALETTMVHISKHPPYPAKKTRPTPAALETTVVVGISSSTESTSSPAHTTIITESPSTQHPLPTTITTESVAPIAETAASTMAPITHPTTEQPLVPSTSALPLLPEIESTTAEFPVSESAAPETSALPEETTSIASEAPAVPTIPAVTHKAPTLPPVDFDCKGKVDGYYADPKDKCSPFFYACVGGLGRRLQCPAEHLVYEPDTGMCERRHDSFRCTGTRKTTVPTTPRRQPPPTVSPSIIDCKKLNDGPHADPQKKCSHIFYSCANGIGYRLDCPGKMYYDVASKACQAFQDVEACSGKKPAPTTKTTPIPRGKIPIDCSTRPSGNYPDPAKKCSSIFYVCSNGDGLKGTCAEGTFFDVVQQICDFHHNVFACSGITRPPTKATQKPAPSPASLPLHEFNCKGKKDGPYLPESKKCSAHYYRCVAGAAYKFVCPSSLYYDITKDRCERFDDLFVCSGKKPTLANLVTSTNSAPQKLPIDCSQLKDGDHPDPEKKCSMVYYTCSNHLGTRRLCPPGTYFEKHNRICDLRENVPDCGGKLKPLPAAAETKRPPVPPPKVNFNCEKRKDGNYASNKCSAIYYTCVGGDAILAYCPGGTAYDPEHDQCGFKNELPACGGTRPVTNPTTGPAWNPTTSPAWNPTTKKPYYY